MRVCVTMYPISYANYTVLHAQIHRRSFVMETYEKLELEIVLLEGRDVITSSPCDADAPEVA